jgi:hypothetical protein
MTSAPAGQWDWRSYRFGRAALGKTRQKLGIRLRSDASVFRFGTAQAPVPTSHWNILTYHRFFEHRAPAQAPAGRGAVPTTHDRAAQLPPRFEAEEVPMRHPDKSDLWWTIALFLLLAPLGYWAYRTFLALFD